MPDTLNKIKCPQCESDVVQATGSMQMRQIRHEKRLTADMECQECGHSWWSTDDRALSMARDVDKRRIENAAIRD